MAIEPNGRVRLSWVQIVTLVSWLVAGILAYGAVDSRVSVLEARYDRLVQDVAEIKADVKILIQRP